jgi:hypothetical protein
LRDHDGTIALDAGSTDSGPAYLAAGKSKYSRKANGPELEAPGRLVLVDEQFV